MPEIFGRPSCVFCRRRRIVYFFGFFSSLFEAPSCALRLTDKHMYSSYCQNALKKSSNFRISKRNTHFPFELQTPFLLFFILGLCSFLISSGETVITTIFPKSMCQRDLVLASLFLDSHFLR